MSEGCGTGITLKQTRASWEGAISIGVRDIGGGPQVQEQRCVMTRGCEGGRVRSELSSLEGWPCPGHHHSPLALQLSTLRLQIKKLMLRERGDLPIIIRERGDLPIIKSKQRRILV